MVTPTNQGSGAWAPRAPATPACKVQGPGALGCTLAAAPCATTVATGLGRRPHRTPRRGLRHLRRRLQEIEHVQRHRPHGRVVPAGDRDPAPQGADPNDGAGRLQRDVDRDRRVRAARQRVLDRGVNVGGDLRRQVHARGLARRRSASPGSGADGRRASGSAARATETIAVKLPSKLPRTMWGSTISSWRAVRCLGRSHRRGGKKTDLDFPRSAPAPSHRERHPSEPP